MSRSALPIVLALAAIGNYALAAVVWYFPSRPKEYLSLMKRIQLPQVFEPIQRRATGPNDLRKARAAAIICATIPTAVLIPAVCLWIFKTP
jgi:hypothetical protein